MGNNGAVEHGKVQVREHSTYETAQNAAYSETSNTAGWTFPVVIFRQGNRLFLAGAFPIGFVESRLFSASVEKGVGVTKASSAMNRPLEPKHMKSIASYLKENVKDKYIIPPITLNVQETVSLHTIESGPSFKAGYLVIPSGVNLSITDGQHRVKGIIEAVHYLDDSDPDAAQALRGDSISAMITCEHSLLQIHQDFADCSKTKALPASLLSLYDTRNPANRLVFELEQNCPLFKGKIDSTSKTLSKKSLYLFLANQIRQMVKHLLTRGNPTDAQFELRARECLSTKELFEQYRDIYIKFVNLVSETIPVLKEISDLPIDKPSRAQIPKFRDAGWICLAATGLNVIGCIGHDLITHDVQDWHNWVIKLGEIDWRRNAEIWQGSIIQDGKLMTQSSPVKRAAEAVKKQIGLSQDVLGKSEFINACN